MQEWLADTELRFCSALLEASDDEIIDLPGETAEGRLFRESFLHEAGPWHVTDEELRSILAAIPSLNHSNI